MRRIIHTVIVAFMFLTLGVISCNSSTDNSSRTRDTTTGSGTSDTTRSLDSPRNNLDSANRSN